jgi:uncharacterized membrane protein
MIWMTVYWILGIALVAGVLWLFFNPAWRTTERGEPPETTLKRRYASGEINSEEYERKLADLRR